jgi:hypothetical protein
MVRLAIWIGGILLLTFVRYLIFRRQKRILTENVGYSDLITFKNVVIQEVTSVSAEIWALLLTSFYIAATFMEKFVRGDDSSFYLFFPTFLLLILMDIVNILQVDRNKKWTISQLLNYSIFVLLHISTIFTIGILYYSGTTVSGLKELLFLFILPLLAGHFFWLSKVCLIRNILFLVLFYFIYSVFWNSFIFRRYLVFFNIYSYLFAIIALSGIELLIIASFDKIRTVFTGFRGIAYYNFIFMCIILLVIVQVVLSV